MAVVLPFERPPRRPPDRRRRTAFRVWAPRPERVVLRAGGREHALAGRGPRRARGSRGRGARRGPTTPTCSTASSSPTPPRRWQPDGLRGPLARARHRRVRVDATPTSQPPALDDARHLRAARRHVHARGHVRGRDPAPRRRCASSASPRSSCMPVAEFPGRRGWGYDGVYLSAAQSSYGGPRGLQQLVDAAHARGPRGDPRRRLQPRRRLGRARRSRRSARTSRTHYETPWGEAHQLRRRRLPTRVREWALQSAEGWVRDFHLDGLRLDAIHAIIDSQPRAPRRRRSRAACTRRPARARDRRVRPQRPEGDALPRARRLGLRRRLGRRLPPRAARAADRRPRRLLRGVRRARRSSPRRSTARTSTTAATRPSAAAASAPAPTTCRPSASSSSAPNHDQVGNRAFGDRLPPEARPLAAFCTLLSPFTPMLFQGEEYGETAPFQFFSDHIDEEIAAATREGRRREFAAFAEFAGDEVPDPQDPATFERSKLTREGEPEGLRELYARAARGARARAAAGRRRRRASTSTPGWLRVRRGEHHAAGELLPRRPSTCRSSAPVELALVTPRTRRSSPGYVVARRRCRERWSA